jgi:two-component system LytT family response regulator
MNTIRTLIVDDEPLARDGIRQFLQRSEEIQVVGECADGVEAVEAIRTLRPELVFLDIQMPGLGGFEVLESVSPEAMPVVIFVTAYDEHAIRAFNVHALDYILKPIEGQRFEISLARARTAIRLRRNAEFTDKLMALLTQIRNPHRYLDRIMIRQTGKIIFIGTREVDWFQAAGDYVEIHAGGTKHLFREKIGDLEEKLDPREFIRIHRSTIVRLDRIKELHPLFSGEYEVFLHNGQRLGLSKTYREKLFSIASPQFAK